jgi:hypothetical protein
MRREGGRKKKRGRVFKTQVQSNSMSPKGIIEELKFPTDSKNQRYAVAKVCGEEIYTWDQGLVDYLENLNPGEEIEYELAAKPGKWKKFKNVSRGTSGEKDDDSRSGPPGGWDWESARILAITEMKNRSKALEMAAIHANDLKAKGKEKAEMTLKIAEKYLKFIDKNFEEMFDSVSRYIKKEFGKE